MSLLHRMVISRKPSLSVTADAVSGYAAGFSPCGAVDTTGSPPTPVVTGGSGTYTYLWEQNGTIADNGPWNISSATAANPTWSGNQCSELSGFEQWRLTVTDTVTSATAQVTIGVDLVWADLS